MSFVSLFLRMTLIYFVYTSSLQNVVIGSYMCDMIMCSSSVLNLEACVLDEHNPLILSICSRICLYAQPHFDLDCVYICLVQRQCSCYGTRFKWPVIWWLQLGSQQPELARVQLTIQAWCLDYVTSLIMSMPHGQLEVGRGSDSRWTLCTPPRSDMLQGFKY